MAIFKKRKLNADELAAKKLQFEEIVGHKIHWERNNGNMADAVYAIPGRNIVVGVTVDLTVPEVAEAHFP